MSTPTSNKKVKTPYQVFTEELKAFTKASGLEGNMLVRGIEEDDGEDDDDENVDNSKLTAEQMEYLRFVMITKERGVFLELYRKKMLGDQAESHILMFNTSFSYTVFSEHKCLQNDLKYKSLVQKFNLLFAFTYTILSYDHWLRDHEDEEFLVAMIKDLAKRWKALLKKTDDELGIDTKHTRPGIVVLLHDFKTRVETAEHYGDGKIAFNFQ